MAYHGDMVKAASLTTPRQARKGGDDLARLSAVRLGRRLVGITRSVRGVSSRRTGQGERPSDHGHR